ncbi:ion channel protein [Microlunatus ginsengisoli]|uniref:Ion channel protein n=1 Tax=Microlunatus ginsengisoli TaxID=363863 RepID=A0ABP6ZJ13_9ACTN
MTEQAATAPAPMPLKQLAMLAIPALIVGVASALILWLLNTGAGLLEGVLWTSIPSSLGLPDDSRLWTFVVLTVIGAAVGLVVWQIPGHAGHDSATTELVAPPLPLKVIPGLALAVLLSLAGGVSLGPENPIIAINVAISVALLGKLWPKIPPRLILMLAAAGTIGALFDTPVAAALIFTGMAASIPGPGALFDKLFLPLVSAGAGAITMTLLGQESMAFPVPPYPQAHAIDLLTGTIIAAVAVLLGLAAAVALPRVHTLFHRMRNPLIYTTIGGLVLGLLGAIGGRITLFKGLSQTDQLLTNYAQYGFWTLLSFALIKVVALVISASAGFRGGRIFPAVFIGAALGLAAHALVPSIPVGLAVGCGAFGATLAIARDGWVALFIGVITSGGMTILPILCIVILPTWLMVSRAPLMLVTHPVDGPAAEPEPAGKGA